MNIETFSSRLIEHETKLENHAVRLTVVEKFADEARKSLNKILIGMVLAAFAAIVDLAVRR
jgi:hypothetical protein